ncbi:50S ribosomal protein L23 [Wolinella succinogenes]|jgi:large subunit ribosomal protein L23|uniref:Large ribosomal subunit protein uL23 n=1 Tax=Wolinella succinogenes (strain ATCC 29543 / DSM 1740 / CCUG 13145 / JCM 31913 / LMG 7466 / NCTC 11488 / FDC 602W) TaxID=273121 RepID=RL23_WOLSU|nr:50S ribosomal protein L23 [Wolinella succinogenes]Q7M8D6.1 RecName: Full=Large ribosomal subunit protein uL23; AltName: Full=50S ribosomal protein L23 [Wolinella succinogenes DSM 1740]HCZ18583.1 50S ribosomal protein L23 [Helicobacter sp.]NLU34669.1 50S ribosomal protein L23 [Wolinella succinogenes]CAE10740.1 50S RIBOSOMAL PROTEIN L23 [Wolinella succinogenes]VEG80890.1 50S ribosomal protein L23 [Wolinella succinogenes]
MADITDIKSIMYTEKSLQIQESGVLVVQTSPKVSKNQLKEVFKEYFGFTPVRVNSLRQAGKIKRFRGVEGKRASFKKFYVKLPEGAKIESLAV